MYHATDLNNLGSIMREGIRPSIEGVVYLTEDQSWAATFVALRGYKTILVLPVEVDSVIETNDHSEEFFNCKAYGYQGVIEPYKICFEEAVKYENPLCRQEIIGK